MQALTEDSDEDDEVPNTSNAAQTTDSENCHHFYFQVNEEDQSAADVDRIVPLI